MTTPHVQVNVKKLEIQVLTHTSMTAYKLYRKVYRYVINTSLKNRADTLKTETTNILSSCKIIDTTKTANMNRGYKLCRILIGTIYEIIRVNVTNILFNTIDI